MQVSVNSAAKILFDARIHRQTVSKFTSGQPDLSLEQAYLIQEALVSLAVQTGERVIGTKMGLTSQAKMKQMGVEYPIYGTLTDAMLLQSGNQVDASQRIHPKIEPEVAFILSRDLDTTEWKKVSETDPDRTQRRKLAFEAIDSVVGALEIIDSRYDKFEFELADVIADNTSACHFVLGAIRLKPTDLDLANLGITLFENEVPKQFASSAAVLGNPLDSLVAQLDLLTLRSREGLKKGDIVLTGGATAAIPMQKGATYRANIQELGITEVTYV